MSALTEALADIGANVVSTGGNCTALQIVYRTFSDGSPECYTLITKRWDPLAPTSLNEEVSVDTYEEQRHADGTFDGESLDTSTFATLREALEDIRGYAY